jgi:DNA-directed RNA polymerase subunit RPC12/RpoP
MKFLCLDCDAPMKLHSSDGPDEGSLSIVFRCPECGFRVAMLTNAFETQMVKSLGVAIGGRTAPPAPFEQLRASMVDPRDEGFTASEPTGETASACPFAAMMNEGGAPVPTEVPWTAEAQGRIERIPSFIRPMARRAIERYAESKGYAAITEAVMDEARGVFGM